jgi:hypothetical protein
MFTQKRVKPVAASFGYLTMMCRKFLMNLWSDEKKVAHG